MQDASVVQVLETRYDLSEVIPHLGLCQCVPGLPNVCEGLERQSNEGNVRPAPIIGTATQTFLCSNKELEMSVCERLAVTHGYFNPVGLFSNCVVV